MVHDKNTGPSPQTAHIMSRLWPTSEIHIYGVRSIMCQCPSISRSCTEYGVYYRVFGAFNGGGREYLGMDRRPCPGCYVRSTANHSTLRTQIKHLLTRQILRQGSIAPSSRDQRDYRIYGADMNGSGRGSVSGSNGRPMSFMSVP